MEYTPAISVVPFPSVEEGKKVGIVALSWLNENQQILLGFTGVLLLFPFLMYLLAVLSRAAADAIQARSRQGQEPANRSRIPEWLRDHVLVQCRLCRGRRADVGADQGEPGQDRHQGRHSKAAGCSDLDAR